jgi:hypothetical protein
MTFGSMKVLLILSRITVCKKLSTIAKQLTTNQLWLPFCREKVGDITKIK